MSKTAKRVPCNWLIMPGMKSCINAAVAMIAKAGYCKEHLSRAEKIFGPSTKIFREELFER